MPSINNLTSIPTPAPRPTPASPSKAKSTSAPAQISSTEKPQAVRTPKAGIIDIGSPFTAMIENIKTTFQAAKTIATAAGNQAKIDRAQGTGIIAGMKQYSGRVSDTAELIEQNAKRAGLSQTQIRQLSLEQLGAFAQEHTYNMARETLMEGAIGSTSLSPESIANRSTLDLIFDNIGLGADAPPVTQGTPASPGAAQSGGVTGATAAASATTGTASQILGWAGAAYSAYQIFANWGKTDPVNGAVTGFTAGAYMGSAFGPWGAAIGGVLGGLVGLASGLFKSGKSQAQLARDQVRATMKNGGMITENWELPLAGGALYDIGKDGGFKLTNIDGKTTRRAYEVDFSNPLAAETVGMMQPLAFLLTGGDPVLANQFTGYFTNAALSNAKDIEGARLNGLAILQSMKVEPEKLAQGIAEMVKQGALSESIGKAYINGLATLVAPSAKGKTPKAA